jgi:acetylornithine deacetylase
VDPVSLARALIDIDSTTGREVEAGTWLADYLRGLSYQVIQQPVVGDRFNVYAHGGTEPLVVFSTHFDCVPPFFKSREERGLLFGRGSCDAKGILAAQIAAAERLSAKGLASPTGSLLQALTRGTGVTI